MDKIELAYPTERPGPLRVGDYVKHASHGLFLVARVNFYSPEKVGLVSLYGRGGDVPRAPIVTRGHDELDAVEAKHLLYGKLDGWHRLTRDEAGADLQVPF